MIESKIYTSAEIRAALPDGNGCFEACPDLLTQDELIRFLRVPQVSKAKNYHNVIETSKKMGQEKLPWMLRVYPTSTSGKIESKSGREIFAFKKCPYHTDDDGHEYECCLIVESDGKFGASCKHESGTGWKDFKPLIGWDKHIQNVKQGLGLTNALCGMESAEFADLLSRDAKTVELFVADFSKCLQFPLEAMPSILRPMIEVGAVALQCPADYIGVTLLVSLGGAIGRTHVIELKAGWYEPTALWIVIVGPPGSTKTPAQKISLSPLYEIQDQWLQEHSLSNDRYKESLKIYKKSLKMWEKDKKQGSPPEEPEKPICERIIVSDTTVEALAPLMRDNSKGMILARDELAGWITSMNQYKGGRGSDVQNFLTIWSGGAIIVDREGSDEPISIPHTYLTVLGSCQPEILQKLLDDERQQDGFASRILVSFPEYHEKKWVDDGIDETVLRPVNKLFEKLCNIPMPMDLDGEKPNVVKFQPSAYDTFKEVMNDHYAQKNKYGFGNELMAAWAKMEAYLARLTLVIHLVRFHSGEVRDVCVDQAMSVTV